MEVPLSNPPEAAKIITSKLMEAWDQDHPSATAEERQAAYDKAYAAVFKRIEQHEEQKKQRAELRKKFPMPSKKPIIMSERFMTINQLAKLPLNGKGHH